MNSKPKPWVLVQNSGCDDEKIIAEFCTYREAMNGWRYGRYDATGTIEADVMRRLPDNTLTTEF